ncbi:hypothetical protein ASD64_15770 [Mesorhizobium sp. Root157]|nr:hypothetical protein ASD64_15770 [Mesorhizobium sp. Root157]
MAPHKAEHRDNVGLGAALGTCQVGAHDLKADIYIGAGRVAVRLDSTHHAVNVPDRMVGDCAGYVLGTCYRRVKHGDDKNAGYTLG